ncbi:MAG: tetratricopeptide repeat protein [Thermodesulfobacteriota bacterium]
MKISFKMALFPCTKKEFTPFALGTVFLSLLALLLIFSGCAHQKKVDKLKESSYVHYRLGNEYYKTGNIADALKEFTRAISIYPEEPSYHLMLGFAYSARDLDKEAREEMQKAVSLDPMFSEGHIGLASLYQKDGDWDGVIKECGLALKNIYYKTPETAYFNMGLAYYNKGDYEASLEHLKKAVAMKPGMAVSYYNMGLAFERLKRSGEAVAAYRKAVELQVEYMEPYYRLGVVLVKKSEKQEALQAFEKVVELAPGSSRANSAREYMELLR